MKNEKKTTLLKTGIPGFNKLKKAMDTMLKVRVVKAKSKAKNFSEVDEYISQRNYESKLNYINQTGRPF